MSTKRYLTCAETAKLVRQSLAKAFPTTTFSVRSSTYSGGASIRVSWTDGPLAHQVDAICRPFSGATFDPMIDLKSYVASTLDGEAVQFGADYIFTSRTLSHEAETIAEARAWLTDHLSPGDQDDMTRRARCLAYNRDGLAPEAWREVAAVTGYGSHDRRAYDEVLA